LEKKIDAASVVSANGVAPLSQPLAAAAADAVLNEIGRAQRPLVLTGPAMAHGRGRATGERLAAALGVPVICMESPRGVNDPCLGAFSEVLRQADVIVLLGKQPDFTLRFGAPPAVAVNCRFAVLDPDPAVLERSLRTLTPPRVLFSALADPVSAAEMLTQRSHPGASRTWADEVQEAIRFRPAEWTSLTSAASGPLHPVEVGRAVQRILERAREPLLIADGGEFGQWAQACVTAPTRLINGPAGSIGSALPFALAARLARPDATVVAMLGDGTFGFHLAEIDTATRARVPFVAVIGNDACWNAEHQIQLRSYGRDRAHGCELLPARYDEAVVALGGHGELVGRALDLPAALDRALQSQRPACVNVMIERIAAPAVSRLTPEVAQAAH
jgi:thiamine pyrophosphate-dependent acetolactate synthase large subunit-like protein